MIESQSDFLYEIKTDGKEIFAGTHKNPDAEEIVGFVALYLAAKFLPKDTLEEFIHRYAIDGVIYLGIRESEFNEHPDPGRNKPRQVGECAATLLVKALKEYGFDAERLPAFKNILEFVTDKDLNATKNPLDLAGMTTKMYLYYSDQPKKVADLIIEGFLAKFKEEPDSPTFGNFTIKHIKGLKEIQEGVEKAEHWYKAMAEADTYFNEVLYAQGVQEYLSGVEIDEFTVIGRPIRLGYIEADNYTVAKASRSKEARDEGKNVDVLVQKKSSGHVFVFPNRFFIKLHRIAALVRNDLRAEKGLEPLEKSNPLLYAEGQIEGAEELFYFKGNNGEFLLNGSEKYPFTSPYPPAVSAKVKGHVKKAIWLQWPRKN